MKIAVSAMPTYLEICVATCSVTATATDYQDQCLRRAARSQHAIHGARQPSPQTTRTSSPSRSASPPPPHSVPLVFYMSKKVSDKCRSHHTPSHQFFFEVKVTFLTCIDGTDAMSFACECAMGVAYPDTAADELVVVERDSL